MSKNVASEENERLHNIVWYFYYSSQGYNEGLFLLKSYVIPDYDFVLTPLN